MFNWLINTMRWPLERHHNQFFAQVSVIYIFNTTRDTLSSTNCLMSTRKNTWVWDLVILGDIKKACTNEEWLIYVVHPSCT